MLYLRAMIAVLAGITLALLMNLVSCSQSANAAQPEKLPVIQVSDEPPAWLDLATRIHAKHTGQKNYLALIGDSITFTDAFWTPLEFTNPEQYIAGDDGLPRTPAGKRWNEVILGLRAKGMEHCNGSGWQVGHILRTLDKMMERERPAVAIIMVGTNDIGSGQCPPAYEDQLERIVEKVIDYKCIPVLNTIPPRRDRDEAVIQANKYIRSIAKRKKLPLIDYYAEITKRQPMEKMYETLMQADGIHPSGGKTNVFTEENISQSGYALRNWLTFVMYREIYFRVLHPEELEKLTKKD